MRATVSLCGVVRGEAPGLEEWLAAADPHVDEIVLLDAGGPPGRLHQVAADRPAVRVHRLRSPLRERPEAVCRRLARHPFVLRLDASHHVLESFWARLPGLVTLLQSTGCPGLRLPLFETHLRSAAGIEVAVADEETETAAFTDAQRSLCVLVRREQSGADLDERECLVGQEPVIVLDATDTEIPRIVVSLLVHEAAEVVADQVSNIQAFLPGAIVVLHASRDFVAGGRFDVRRFSRLPNVLVNPEHRVTGWATTALTPAILSNFRHASNVADFDYFLLDSSNDLYVRPGAGREIARHQAACRLDPLPSNHSPQSASARNDRGLAAMCAHLGGAAAYVSGHEGTYFQKDLFAEMASMIDRYALEDVRPFTTFGDPDGDYGKEEYYFSTAAGALASSIGTPLIYRDFVAQPSISVQDVAKVLEGRWRELPLRQGEGFFGVKRVARVYDDPTRVCIRGLVERLSTSEGHGHKTNARA